MKKIIFLGLMLVACDTPKPDPSTTTTTTTATTTSVNQVVTAADPAATTGPVLTAIPTASSATSGWPLPDYPAAKVTKKTADFVSLETKDAPDKVVAFYKDKLSAAGFPPGPWARMSANASQATVMTASKGAQMVQVTVTPVQGTTKISVSSI